MNKESLNKLLAMANDDEFNELADRINDHMDTRNRITKDSTPTTDRNDIRTKNFLADLSADLQFQAEISKDGIGLILNGGGAKGCYQVGAVSAIREKNVLSFTGYSGTSIGALNAAALSASDVETAKAMWSNITNNDFLSVDDILHPDLENDAALRNLLVSSGILDKIGPTSPITSVTAFDVESGYPADFVLNGMEEADKLKALMASAAFPIAFEQQEIEEVFYVDGGFPVFGDNMPVTPLYLLGFRKFIVIHTQSYAEARHNALMAKLNADVNKHAYYNGAMFVHLFPSRDMGDTLSGTMNFTPDYIAQGMELGYRDALAAHEFMEQLSVSAPDSFKECHVVNGKTFRSYEDLLA
ncbi:MAG: patatin-like phospholipase family protein [Lachnospiraceae bacterium]|nr:patatin-like phospholipase family protein [Lachnospiraceae bacterium]